MVQGSVPSIQKIEFQLMRNKVHKIYTTSSQDAITYGWETSTDIRSFYGRPVELPELEEPEPVTPTPTPPPSPTPPVTPIPPSTPAPTPTPAVSPSVQLVDGTYQIEFGSRMGKKSKVYFYN